MIVVDPILKMGITFPREAHAIKCLSHTISFQLNVLTYQLLPDLSCIDQLCWVTVKKQIRWSNPPCTLPPVNARSSHICQISSANGWLSPLSQICIVIAHHHQLWFLLIRSGMLRATRRTEKFKKKEQINISYPVVSLFLIFSFYFPFCFHLGFCFPLHFLRPALTTGVCVQRRRVARHLQMPPMGAPLSPQMAKTNQI